MRCTGCPEVGVANAFRSVAVNPADVVAVVGADQPARRTAQGTLGESLESLDLLAEKFVSFQRRVNEVLIPFPFPNFRSNNSTNFRLSLSFWGEVWGWVVLYQMCELIQ